MNAPIQAVSSGEPQHENEIDLAACLDLLFDHRWLIVSITMAVTLLGAIYAFSVKPTYSADILVQVEDGPNSSKSLLGGVSALLDVKAAANSEMELLRSRLVVSRAVDTLQLYVDARPKHFPLFGAWWSGRWPQLSNPGLFGYGGYAWGAERIEVALFNVSEALQNRNFVLTVEPSGQFLLKDDDADINLQGKVGTPLKANNSHGEIELTVAKIVAKPGTQFLLTRKSRLDTIRKLQGAMLISEKGKQSGIIGITLTGENPRLTSNILNEIGHEYVRQNVERISEEYEKSLVFLNEQLPEIKRELEQSESKYNQFRNMHGTIDLGEEAKLALQQSVAAQTKLVELRQKREELLVRFTSDHPAVVGLDRQMKDISIEMRSIGEQIKGLPKLEQDTLRLTRDIKVNTDLYSALLKTAQQTRVAKSGKVGNVRLVDAAVVPEHSVAPRRGVIIALSVFLGLVLGVMCAALRKMLYGGIDSPHELEQALGLSVYATIPHSKKQEELYVEIVAKASKNLLLAQVDPTDLAVESLRSFRTALQFSMLDAASNILLITGPTPGLGKSFISANVAVVLAAAGKRVLLVDVDMRKGQLHQYFGFARENGLSELVAGANTVEQSLRRDVIENLDFLSTGNLPPNPAELLMHENFAKLLQSLAPDYDYVMLDAPPVLAVSDSLIVARQAGAIYMVVRANVSTMGEIKESLKRLQQAGMSNKGILFNGLRMRPGRYGHGSKYGKYRYTEYAY
ncbi:Tyrosine-protein kinase Wzc [Collimonas arenae]|uniref:Putative tyrosine-protein kinase EpsB n=1 Tax=Collimonas arenae TaxID=279058 RepID=A0A0A1FKJ2_9BURK|nr:polysaccharide biosynthesis tyrosine autokinase [Collimonas arenae]AIY43417.1 Tyrosine-protein kinase Wzc [Collimonas arenae]